jgi:two-component system sensor histidine kinase DesK
MDHLHPQRGEGLNSPDQNSVFRHCEDTTGAAQSLIEQMGNAELSLRGGTLLRSGQGKSLFGTRRPGKARFFDFIWLIYSVFFFIQPIEEHSRTKWIALAAAYLCFLALYSGLIFSKSKRTQFLLLAGMAALGAAYYPFNAGAAGMFIYVAAFVPFVSESIAVCVTTFVAVSGILMVEAWRLHANPWNWGFNIFFTIAVGSGNLVAAQRMRANKKLDLAHEQIAHLAKLAERERIARDLHDVLGHTLSVVVLKSELAGKLMDRDPGRARHEIAEVEQIARKALTDVREAIRGYRTEGLVAEIVRAQKTLDAAGVTLECLAKPPQLAPAEETVLSLIVREAVTNIVRHAQASRCRLEFAANGTGTALVVEDDGRGGIREEGNGLRGMRERVESMGGQFRIDSAQGTRLLIEIPPQTASQS